MKSMVPRQLVVASRISRMLIVIVEDRPSAVLLFWVSLAAVLTSVSHVALARQAFVYDHALTSATFATLARSFVAHGVIGLGGVPILNSGPLGPHPDAYIHWPPLFPIMLSAPFRVFGDAEGVAHGMMLVVLIANAAALYALVKACAGREAGLFSAFVFMVLPVTATYGHLVIPEHPAMLGTLMAVWAFVKATRDDHLDRRWAIFGVLSLVFAVWMSWEPVFASAGFLIAALWNRSTAQRRLALGYLCASAAAVSIVLGIYLLSRPDLGGHLWHTALFRVGVADQYPIPTHPFSDEIQTLGEEREVFRLPPWRWLLLTFARRLELIGEPAIVAIGAIVISAWVYRGRADGRGPVVVMFGALAAMWVLWFTIFLNHAYFHDIMMLLAAPAAAAALGFCSIALVRLARRASEATTTRVVVWALLVILPAALTMTIPLKMLQRYYAARYASDIAIGRTINKATPPEAVIMVSSTQSIAIPIYYANRHLIAVSGDAVVEKLQRRVGDALPEAPVYLAVRPGSEIEPFQRSVQRFRLVKEAPDVLLFAVE